MKKLNITILVSEDRTVEKVLKTGFGDQISGTFEYIGLLEALKVREITKLKNWIRVETNSEDEEKFNNGR